jgi:NAD+ synthase
MSAAAEVHKITEFMAKVLKESGTKGFALGLSGGIDSAVCAALAKRAIDKLNLESLFDKEAQTFYSLDLIALPMGNIAADAEVAQEVADFLGVGMSTIKLGAALDAFTDAFAIGRTVEFDAKSKGNIKARLRMTAIYAAANHFNLLVIGTDNSSETYTGYFTKHGDGAADIFPLSAFSKREVYELGRELNLPESVLVRAPSAGLWEGQTDESEMGVPYAFIDNVIEGVPEANKSLFNNIMCDKYERTLKALHESTEHKRAAAHVYDRFGVL